MPNQQLNDDLKSENWHCIASAVTALVVIALGFEIFNDITPIRYLAFLAWFGALLLLFRSWALFSIAKPRSIFAIGPVLHWLDQHSHTGKPNKS
jgi:hypothetical protein